MPLHVAGRSSTLGGQQQMSERCKAELIFPAGQIDRCQRIKHPEHGWHRVDYSDGIWCDWFGGVGREKAWPETQAQFVSGWRAAGRTEPAPIYEHGPRFTGEARVYEAAHAG